MKERKAKQRDMEGTVADETQEVKLTNTQGITLSKQNRKSSKQLIK